MTVKFTIVSGEPSEIEAIILQQVINQHKRVERQPVVKRSNWAAPIMRAPMPQAIRFGAGRNI